MIIAHTKDGKTFTNESECHELITHLKDTANYARVKASHFNAGMAAWVVAFLHDFGKFSPDFQARIRGESKKSAPHAIAGAWAMVERYGEIGRMFGIVIASHHTGLPDYGVSADPSESTYQGKLNLHCEKHKESFLHCLHNNEPLPELDKREMPKLSKQKGNAGDKEKGFQLATFFRMLFSVLVDSDYTDTEEFCTGIKREPVTLDAALMEGMYAKLIDAIRCKNGGGLVNEIRAKVLENCMDAASYDPGLFTLTVPTGGGKTLSSLVFALKHAIRHGKRRIIYVIPYTSIIEQNADVVREILGEEYILEHHSSIDNLSDNARDFRIRHSTENWDIPIVFTTNVQFFESLFANKTRMSRKIHNITNSVVIFDEAQMLPSDFLSPCLSVIGELVENYRVTAVLCSATQPVLGKYLSANAKNVLEISKNPAGLAEALKRVDYFYTGEKTDEMLVDELCGRKQALVIVNSRRHAYSLFKICVESEKIDNECLIYLSTLIAPVHRSERITEIKKRLDDNLPVTVISTQLVEAGVDIDFPCVYRAIAGIDSIIQAGGRANREGKLINPDGTGRNGEVVVFDPIGESGKVPPSLKLMVSKGKETIRAMGDGAFSLMGIKKYFELLYFSLERDDAMDKNRILDEFQQTRNEFVMNFATAAAKFKLIDDNTQGIVINCNDESKSLIEKLYSGEDLRTVQRRLQKYSVSVYWNEYERLSSENAIQVVNGVNLLVTAEYYKKETGLDLFGNENKNAEAICV